MGWVQDWDTFPLSYTNTNQDTKIPSAETVMLNLPKKKLIVDEINCIPHPLISVQSLFFFLCNCTPSLFFCLCFCFLADYAMQLYKIL